MMPWCGQGWSRRAVRLCRSRRLPCPSIASDQPPATPTRRTGLTTRRPAPNAAALHHVRFVRLVHRDDIARRSDRGSRECRPVWPERDRHNPGYFDVAYEACRGEWHHPRWENASAPDTRRLVPGASAWRVPITLSADRRSVLAAGTITGQRRPEVVPEGPSRSRSHLPERTCRLERSTRQREREDGREAD
jgi:hypothetical protein